MCLMKQEMGICKLALKQRHRECNHFLVVVKLAKIETARLVNANVDCLKFQVDLMWSFSKSS